MTIAYASPVLTRYGAIEALTASAIKCTPGGDFLAAHGHEQLLDGSWVAPAPGSAGHEGETPGGSEPDCTNFATFGG